jgi:DNA (cytosine-5)-methyltransferase 1
MPYTQLTAISLFSGAGGDTLGMLDANINVIGYVEYDKEAIKTHNLNFPNCTKIGEDITKISDEKFNGYKNVDIIFGGFPCQSFSHGGRKDPDDSRSFLYQEFVRAANIIKPKAIIGENVKGLLTRKTKNGDLFINIIIKDFEDIGYDMKYELFNMSEFGIPQSRKRVILYGIRKDLKLSCNLSNIIRPDIKLYNRDVLEFSLKDALKIEEIKKVKYIENMENNENEYGKPPTNLLKCYNNSQISFKTRNSPTHSCIIDLDDVSRTILCSYSRMPRLFVPIRNSNGFYLRPYTIKELQLIQSFPVTFEFSGSYIEKVKQIGNAIPPVFVKYIISYIKDVLNMDILEL